MALDKTKLNELFGNTSSQVSSTEDFDLEASLEEAEDSSAPPANIQINTEAVVTTEQDINVDVDYSRRTTQDLMNQAQRLVSIALDNAAQGAARDIEVAATAIMSAANVTEKLLDIHKKLADIKKPNAQTLVQNNQTINISTTELLDAILNSKEGVIDV